MSYKEVKKILSELSPEQTEFLKTRKYEGRKTMTEWLELFHKLAIVDTLGDKARSTAKALWITFLIITIFSLFLSGAFPFLFVIPLIFLGLFIYFLRNFLKLKKIDLTNQLRLQIYPFLAAIKHDVHKKEKIMIRVDFSNPINKNYLRETIPAKGLRYPRIKTTYYALPYFFFFFTMEDGSEVDFEAEDLIRQRNITKVGSSGKIKSKVKYKIKHTFDLKIAFPKKRYDYLDSNNVMYNDLPEYHQLRLKKKIISTQLETIQTPEILLSIFAGAYQNVKPI